jgi:hypothetical protein
MRSIFSDHRILAGIVVALLLAVVVTGVLPTTTPAYADDTTPVAPKKANGQGAAPVWLEFQLKRAQIAFQAQTDNMARMNDEVAAVQSLINALAAEGKETGDLQAALNAFQGQIKAAQGPHDNAGAVLNAKAGFDAGGAVTDAAQARQTVRDAAGSMADAARINGEARKDLRSAVREFVKARVKVARDKAAKRTPAAQP